MNRNADFTIEKLRKLVEGQDSCEWQLPTPIPREEALAFVEEALTRPEDTMVRIATSNALTSVIVSVKQLRMMKESVLDGTYEKLRKEPYFIDWMWMYN